MINEGMRLQVTNEEQRWLKELHSHMESVNEFSKKLRARGFTIDLAISHEGGRVLSELVNVVGDITTRCVFVSVIEVPL